jgi:hypothetical protein
LTDLLSDGSNAAVSWGRLRLVAQGTASVSCSDYAAARHPELRRILPSRPAKGLDEATINVEFTRHADDEMYYTT